MKNFGATLAGPHSQQAISLISSLPAFRQTLPHTLWINDERDTPSPDWARKLQCATSSSWARWNQDANEQFHQVDVSPRSDLVSFSIPDAFSTAEQGCVLLESVPFEIASMGSVFFHEWIAADYRRWGFDRSHVDLGWGCAFRGAGHDRLVSRRWLDFGPWRVLRRPNDTTIIQFHDLAITDPAEAYEQAKVGHQRMGISAIGGYIAWHMQNLLRASGRGLYVPAERLLEVIVAPGVPVEQGAMIANCALRLHHRLTKPSVDPIDRIAYVFLDLDEARAHLHELWLRELECWVMDGDGRRRLDLDYHPVPDPPAWVRRLDRR